MNESSVKLYESKDTWTQDNDCCDDQSCGQQLIVQTQDGGGGSFIVLETQRWAIDADDIDKFCAMLKSTIERVEKSELK